MVYHLKKKMWFADNYWENPSENFLILNGYADNNFLLQKVVLISELVTDSGTIINLGCGNGYLLSQLMQYNKHELVPFRVDFLPQAITQARKEVHPLHCHHFILANVRDFIFAESFDYVLSDPEYVSDPDFELFFERCYQAVRPGGKLIFYLTDDVWLRLMRRDKTLPIFIHDPLAHWLASPQMALAWKEK